MTSQVIHIKAGTIRYDKYGSRWRTKGISCLSAHFKTLILQVFISKKTLYGFKSAILYHFIRQVDG